uniref:Secreted protein n=1 Tax=Steinernema glaseri TaxID=37863 RepID=A0A1I7Y2E2_9BILA
MSQSRSHVIPLGTFQTTEHRAVGMTPCILITYFLLKVVQRHKIHRSKQYHHSQHHSSRQVVPMFTYSHPFPDVQAIPMTHGHFADPKPIHELIRSIWP